MKKLVFTMATVIGAFVLTACQSTDSSPSPSSSTTSTCTLNAYGQSVCTGTTGSCAALGYTFNGTTWLNSAGQPVACNNTGVTTTGSSGLGGCTYWDSVYPGSNYVPMVDPTTGNLVCINLASYGISTTTLANYGYNSYSQPVYASSCPFTPYNDPYWQSDCQNGYSSYLGSSWNYSGSNYGYSGGSGVCFGMGSGEGSDYGYGDSYFGICL